VQPAVRDWIGPAFSACYRERQRKPADFSGRQGKGVFSGTGLETADRHGNRNAFPGRSCPATFIRFSSRSVRAPFFVRRLLTGQTVTFNLWSILTK
jgi:hypothetical protein